VLFPELYERGRGHIAAAEAKSRQNGNRNFMMIEVGMCVRIEWRVKESF
jgi:hypothetical protein